MQENRHADYRHTKHPCGSILFIADSCHSGIWENYEHFFSRNKFQCHTIYAQVGLHNKHAIQDVYETIIEKNITQIVGHAESSFLVIQALKLFGTRAYKTPCILINPIVDLLATEKPYNTLIAGTVLIGRDNPRSNKDVLHKLVMQDGFWRMNCDMGHMLPIETNWEEVARNILAHITIHLKYA